MTETYDDAPRISGDVWEHDDYIRWTIVLPADLAERVAIEAERRGTSVGDLLSEYAEEGLHRADSVRVRPELAAITVSGCHLNLVNCVVV